MASRLVVGRWCRSQLAATLPLRSDNGCIRPPIMIAAGSAAGHIHLLYQHQQERSRWTKAKKKRYARFQRRQEMAAAGQELPKPPYYFPIDTPVVNAVQSSAQRQQQEVQAQDEQAQAAALAQRRPAPEQQRRAVRRHWMQGTSMSDRVLKLFHIHNGSQHEVVQQQKHQAMQLFQLREGDTGSSAVQVIALTTRIQQLQTHLALHRKDVHSKRGMDALYVRRRKLLDYMERQDFEMYRRVVKTLGLVR